MDLFSLPAIPYFISWHRCILFLVVECFWEITEGHTHTDVKVSGPRLKKIKVCCALARSVSTPFFDWFLLCACSIFCNRFVKLGYVRYENYFKVSTFPRVTPCLEDDFHDGLYPVFRDSSFIAYLILSILTGQQ